MTLLLIVGLALLLLLGRFLTNPVRTLVTMTQIGAGLILILSIIIGVNDGWGEIAGGDAYAPARVALIAGGTWILITALRYLSSRPSPAPPPAEPDYSGTQCCHGCHHPVENEIRR
ncbi:hypothetical protein [Nesterenkonia sp. K-15-9-6]|uniref:hypothetical protein n=1 Tax=Nesterenkonia sp. K-15-9-6 TaxID=3093918 RepID=UPI004044556A